MSADPNGVVTNGKITHLFLGMEDHGIWTTEVGVEDQGGTQSFGGLAFNGVEGSRFMGEWIKGVCKALQVDSWEKLKGTHCRIRRDKYGGPIRSIGHIIHENWFTAQP
jgi:hypothetical protein